MAQYKPDKFDLMRFDLGTNRLVGRHKWMAGSVAFGIASGGAMLFLFDKYYDASHQLGDVGHFGLGLEGLAILVLLFAHWDRLFR